MNKSPGPTPDASEVRRRAEESLRAQHHELGKARTEADTQRLVHELQVHQIELEMQNEELRKARDEVESGLEKISDLFDFSPVGYVTLDRDGTIREANLTSAGMLGIERSRLIMRVLGSFVSMADLPAFNAFLAKVFESGAREACDVTLVKEGKPPVDVRIEAVVDATGRECRAAMTDITDRKRAEVDRLILSKLESTGILAGGIAHDFNNLLTVILLDLELARELTRSGEELARLLEESRNAALTARGLTQQLMAFAKGGAPVRKSGLLPGLIRESVRPALSGSAVRCEFSLADDLWPVEVDEDQFSQVMRNLVLNAREAMPRGGVVNVRAENALLPSREAPSLPPGEYVRISIVDQGIGIPKELLPKIFDPYFSTKQRGDQKGMGLGLTICHSVVQKHGGAITAESEAGVGTAFHIHLPASRKVPREERASAPRTLPRHGRVLVMDDEEVVRKVVGMLLQRMGHEVQLVEEGQRAIDAYRDAEAEGRPFDAVILDLTVRAGMGGQEAIRALLEIDPGVRGIVMSGYSQDAVVLEPERHGFKGVLAKPFEIDRLREVLARVMRAGHSDS